MMPSMCQVVLADAGQYPYLSFSKLSDSSSHAFDYIAYRDLLDQPSLCSRLFDDSCKTEASGRSCHCSLESEKLFVFDFLFHRFAFSLAGVNCFSSSNIYLTSAHGKGNL